MAAPQWRTRHAQAGHQQTEEPTENIQQIIMEDCRVTGNCSLSRNKNGISAFPFNRGLVHEERVGEICP